MSKQQITIESIACSESEHGDHVPVLDHNEDVVCAYCGSRDVEEK